MNLIHLALPVEVLLAIVLLIVVFVASLGFFQSVKLVAVRRRLASPRIAEIDQNYEMVRQIVESTLDHQTSVPMLIESRRQMDITWEQFLRLQIASTENSRGCLSGVQVIVTLSSFAGLAVLDWPYFVPALLVLGLAASFGPSRAMLREVYDEVGRVAVHMYAWALDERESFDEFRLRVPSETTDALMTMVSGQVDIYRWLHSN